VWLRPHIQNGYQMLQSPEAFTGDGSRDLLNLEARQIRVTKVLSDARPLLAPFTLPLPVRLGRPDQPPE
jgi:hypothetical protein